jgi:hypothetical protein
MTCFVLDADTPGVIKGKKEINMGQVNSLPFSFQLF